MDTAEPRYLTADQIATELGVDVQTVQRLFRDGDLPGRKIGRGWRANRTAACSSDSADLPGSGAASPSPV